MIIVYIIVGLLSLIYAIRTFVRERKCESGSTAWGLVIVFFGSLGIITLTIGLLALFFWYF